MKKMPYIFEVRDLWPEFPIQVGAIKNPLLIWILRKLEKSIYKNSEHVVALSPGMEDGVLKCGIAKDKVTMIPNMSKIELFYPRDKKENDFLKYGIDRNCFNVVHIGSMGVANDLMYMMKTAEFLQYKRKNTFINFIIVGDGSTKKDLEMYADEKQLNNVKFLGHWGTEDTSAILNCCDMSFVCFKNLPILYTNSPNKLFDSLSAGKPIIVNSAGWTKKMAEDYNCGFWVDPESPEDFADKLINICGKKDLLAEYSKNSRDLAVNKYDKSILTEQFLEVIKTHTRKY
jgi:glycosyltransferase involved in cell wall biosynthesis